jgi:hypothetical protein
VQIITDLAGNQRCLGCLPPQNSRVYCQSYAAAANPLYSMDQIKLMVTDPTRTRRRTVFDASWIKRGDQKNHGSCNGWATASAYTKIRWLRGFRDNFYGSGAYVYSKINGGQDEGSSLNDDIGELLKWGVCSDTIVTADQIFPQQQNVAAADADAANHKGLVAYHCTTQQELLSGLAAGFIAVVVVQVDDQQQFMNFTGSGILPAFRGTGNHAVHVDDLIWDGSQFLFDIANNWNLFWGDQGRAMGTWSSFQQTFNVHPFYLICSTNEGAQ